MHLFDHSELGRVLEAAIGSTGAIAGNVQLHAAAARELHIVAHRGFRQPFLDHFAVVTTSDGSACGQAAGDRRRVVIGDTHADPAFAPHRAVADEAGFRSVVSAPLFGSRGALLGVLSTHYALPHGYSAAALARLDAYTRLATLMIECRVCDAALVRRPGWRGAMRPALAAPAQQALASTREILAVLPETDGRPELLAVAERQLRTVLQGLGKAETRY